MRKYTALVSVGACLSLALAIGVAAGSSAARSELGGVVATQDAAESYKVDASHSSVNFRVLHLGTSYTYGRFNEFSGSFTYNADEPGQSSFTMNVKTASVDTGNTGRDNHLKNADFFDARQYPEIKFTSTAIKKTAEDRFDLTGDLTLHGVTKSITAKLEHVGSSNMGRFGPRRGFLATFKIKRSDFGMNYLVSEGAVGDEVSLTISLEGMKE